MKFILKLTLIIFASQLLFANEQIAKKWIDEEFQPSTLTKTQQLNEMKWFINASKPYKGMNIRVVTERLPVHYYEAATLAKAFKEITGINVVHEVTGEDDVVKKISTHIEKNINLYDIYVNDTDFIGTHFRSNKVVALSDFMENEGKDVTLPTLDLDDFMGLSYGTGPDGKLYQLPNIQFANLYWYRADWFARADLKEKFKEIYGYELDVPVNWSAYEDIAEFFTKHVKEIDGKRVYGHMDYGKRHPSLGWRFSDAWLSMAGAGDKGLPNGFPVDEWGIRVEECKPVGASVKRGGAVNGAAAIYAVKKYDKWLKEFAPPGSKDMYFTEHIMTPTQGNIAQQVFWYTALTALYISKDTQVVNEDGTPKWKMAPSPRGAYWEEGMKLGYQDVAAWTIVKSVPLKRQKAAWLYAQFLVSKTISLKKTIEGLTPIRKSDVHSKEFTALAPKFGGLVEFYQSRARDLWTPTGTNVPSYPILSQAWWKFIPDVVEEKASVKVTMDNIAEYMDKHLEKLSKKKNLVCAPSLNEEKDESYWLNKTGSPKAKLKNEKPQGKTVSYEESLKAYD